MDQQQQGELPLSENEKKKNGSDSCSLICAGLLPPFLFTKTNYKPAATLDSFVRLFSTFMEKIPKYSQFPPKCLLLLFSLILGI